MSNWEQQLQDSLTIKAVTGTTPRSDDAALVPQLRDAAHRWNKRTDGFADGKASTCLDLADKVERFGSFVSEKQRDYARKLIEWSKPRNQEPRIDAGNVMRAAELRVPKLFGVLQKHTHFHAEPLKLSRKNGESLCWIMFNGVCVGKIENAVAVYFPRKLATAGVLAGRVNELLTEFEQDPLEAAKKYGKLSGRCCSCGRDLTDPESIEAGIGPVCATRFS